MKYLCMGFHDESLWSAMSEDESKAMTADNAAYLSQLQKGGNYVEGRALQGAATATTIRFANGKATVTDGPFAETKEQLGGVMVLEARDLNHAIQLVSKMPCMRVGGSLEIRPINENI